jgi:uncharacterized membrane protein
MNRDALIRSAIAGLFAASVGAGSGALAQDKDQQKCWGIAKAGQNDCGSNKTAHSCAGHAKVDYDPNDFKVVKAGTCVQMGGSLQQGEPGMKAKEKMKG